MGFASRPDGGGSGSGSWLRPGEGTREDQEECKGKGRGDRASCHKKSRIGSEFYKGSDPDGSSKPHVFWIGLAVLGAHRGRPLVPRFAGSRPDEHGVDVVKHIIHIKERRQAHRPHRNFTGKFQVQVERPGLSGTVGLGHDARLFGGARGRGIRETASGDEDTREREELKRIEPQQFRTEAPRGAGNKGQGDLVPLVEIERVVPVRPQIAHPPPGR